MEVFAAIIAPALVGVVIGILSGLLGIGGGTVMVPVLRLAFDMSAIVSTATSLFTIIPTSISGAISHIRHKTCIVPLGVAAGLGGACTSPVGVWLAVQSPSWMIMTAAALTIGYSAISMLHKAYKMKLDAPHTSPGDKKPAITTAYVKNPITEKSTDAQPATSSPAAAVSEEASAANGSLKLSRKQLLGGAGIGLVAGLASGYVGVGGGFIMVPLMLSLLDIPMRRASGTSLIAVMILAIPGVIGQGLLGNIDYAAGIALAVGSVPGAVIGAHLGRKVSERILKFIFGGFLLFAAALLILNETGALG